MHLIPEAITLSEVTGNELCFAFWGDRLLVKTTASGFAVTSFKDLQKFELKLIHKKFIGRVGNCPCYAAELADKVCPDGMALEELRHVFGSMDDELF